MAASARIDELRSKFDENPRRFFAPLANEYRKAGDLSTAIAICRTQLRHFPSHMSGHVVLGQALFEAGDLLEARSVLEKAVELDPENLIALRHLGDIARAIGDTDAAARWYRRALDGDPYNEQIASLYAEVTSSGALEPEPVTEPPPPELEVAPPAFPAEEDEPRTLPAEAVEFVDLGADDFTWAPPEPVRHAEPAPVEEAPEEPVLEEATEPEPESHDATADDEDAGGTFEFIDDWGVAEIDTATAATDEQATPAAAAEVIPSDEPVRDESVAEAGFDPVVGLDLVPPGDRALEQLEHAGPAVEEAAPEQSAPAAPRAPADEEPWHSDQEAPLDLVVTGTFATETMAELCLEQGHEEEALTIFEQLLAQRPGDAALGERVRVLRERLRGHAGATPTAGAFLRDLAARQPSDGVRGPDVGADGSPETAEPSPEAPAEPAEHAESPPSDEGRDAWAARALSSAFGASLPVAPPVEEVERTSEPAAGVGAPVEEAAADEDLSFDRFFAGLEDQQPSAAEPAAPWAPEVRVEQESTAAPAAPSTPAAPVTPAVAEEDDLAEFNAWLRGLRDS